MPPDVDYKMIDNKQIEIFFYLSIKDFEFFIYLSNF